MNKPIVSKWNARYAYSGEPIPAPATVLSAGVRWLPAIDSTTQDGSNQHTPTALDLACGRAGNAHWLAQRGYRVSAWDISDTVIEEIRSRPGSLIHDAAVRDVSEYPPAVQSFDIIVVSRFLDRNLCPAIVAALTPGGTLFYQTFTKGLSNPDYLLAQNELLHLFTDLDILEYHEPEPNARGKAEARLIARRTLLA